MRLLGEAQSFTTGGVRPKVVIGLAPLTEQGQGRLA